MKSTFDIAKVPQEQLVAFFGLPFAVAAIDGSVEKEELLSIFENIDLDLLDDENKKKVSDFIISPPNYNECIIKIANGSDELRFAVIVNVVDVILADDLMEHEEKEFLDFLCAQLNITNSQKEAIINFVKETKRVIREGLDSNIAEKTIKNAVSGLAAVGVPIAAVYMSGSVIGLSAAGLTSGLAALGLGLGMVSGIGTAILIGTGVFLGAKKILGDSNHKKETILKERNERKFQLVIKNLQEAIDKIITRITELEDKAKIAEANEEAIELLRKRLTALQKALKVKQQKLNS
jgi:hypothetical protein